MTGGNGNALRNDLMRKKTRYRVVALLIAAACAGLVVTAIFAGGTSALERPDDTARPRPRVLRPDAGSAVPAVSSLAKSYACPQCGSRIDWGSETCGRCGWSRESLMRQAALTRARAGRPAGRTEVTPGRKGRAAFQTVAVSPAAVLPSPRDQNAAGKEFIEGHWLGLEVITLAPELAKEYGIPKGQTGVLVDEITLEAAESGILAGDMVQYIGEHPTPDLKAFFLATQRMREQGQAQVGISRRGRKMAFVIEARNTKQLGFAQMEAAQPIMPGSISPHRSRGRPCTDCHIIMRTGGQLPTDAGDILPNPPPIATDAKAPHGDRGRCSTCHVVR